MTSLLYGQYSSDLTKDEIIGADKRVAKNREGVKKLPSNSKGKAKRLGSVKIHFQVEDFFLIIFWVFL